MPPLVVQTEHLPEVCQQWLAERVDLHACPADSLRFKELLPDIAGVVVRTYTTVDKRMLEEAGKLRVVGRAGVGLDNIDLPACRNHGVRVVHTPEANAEAVVEFVLSAVLPRIRPLEQLHESIELPQWKLLRDNALTQREFSETTLGILGFGRIGSRLGATAAAMGFRVIYNDLRQIEAPAGCEQVDLDDLLEQSHVLSIHVDGRADNRHFLSSEHFSRLSEDMVLVNSARGFVLDAEPLSHFLRGHPDACAILDVHEEEPFGDGYPLLGLPNARLYPHIAARTERALLNMGWVVRDVAAILAGDAPAFEKL
ncbi:MAG: NAD(P)-dependent oxidoreductase [Phycisphaerales bacterium]|nr:NAD(P)-dependent oxidoreductase [Phycisphaerales bacterium]